MTFDEFFTLSQKALYPGSCFQNPGGGTSRITSFSPCGAICYQRGNAKIYVQLKDLYDAYQHFSGSICSGPLLRQFNPTVFDSKHNGHSCNCTFLFLLLQAIDVVSEIQGKGTSGHPFYVEIPCKY